MGFTIELIWVEWTSLYNFLKIWQQVKKRKSIYFFPSIYVKMNWSFNYFKVMRRINQSSKRTKKKRKKKERKKENKNNFFPSIYMKMNWSFIYLKVMRRISQSFDFILILCNGSESKCVKEMTKLWKLLLTVGRISENWQ